MRLQKIRERHNNDIRHVNIELFQKMEEDERKRMELEELKRKSTQQRTSLRNGLKNAYDFVKTERNSSKMAIKERLK